jgi:hypothetical protein
MRGYESLFRDGPERQTVPSLRAAQNHVAQ